MASAPAAVPPKSPVGHFSLPRGLLGAHPRLRRRRGPAKKLRAFPLPTASCEDFWLSLLLLRQRSAASARHAPEALASRLCSSRQSEPHGPRRGLEPKWQLSASRRPTRDRQGCASGVPEVLVVRAPRITPYCSICYPPCPPVGAGGGGCLGRRACGHTDRGHRRHSPLMAAINSTIDLPDLSPMDDPKCNNEKTATEPADHTVPPTGDAGFAGGGHGVLHTISSY